MSAFEAEPEFPHFFVEIEDGSYVCRIQCLGYHTTNSTIVIGVGGRLFGIGVGWIDDIIYTSGSKMHVQNPAPVKAFGVWTWGFLLLEESTQIRSTVGQLRYK